MSKPRMNEQTSRLSETLLHMAPGECGVCKRTASDPDVKRMELWQEHDHNDKPEQRFVWLCDTCAGHIIDPHPRLYARLDPNAPAPGAMEICRKCVHRRGWKCTQTKASGGPGIVVNATKGMTVHIDGTKNGKRFGFWHTTFPAPPSGCTGRKER
jgi:hypothetical protein